jgi:hypothetical protein
MHRKVEKMNLSWISSIFIHKVYNIFTSVAVTYIILSVTSPGAQGFGNKAEIEANEYLAKAAKNPIRFGAFCVGSFGLNAKHCGCRMRSGLRENCAGQSKN